MLLVIPGNSSESCPLAVTRIGKLESHAGAIRGNSGTLKSHVLRHLLICDVICRVVLEFPRRGVARISANHDKDPYRSPGCVVNLMVEDGYQGAGPDEYPIAWGGVATSNSVLIWP